MDEKEKKPTPEDGAVEIKKRSALGTVVGVFLEDTGRGLLSYFVNEHFIPFVEKSIRDLADRVLMKLGGTVDTGDRDSNYRRYGNSSRRAERKSRDPFGIDRIILKSRLEAERILRGLEEQIDQFRVASVADLYELLEEDCRWTANVYGWTSMRGARIVTVSEGYHLRLPKVMPID